MKNLLFYSKVHHSKSVNNVSTESCTYIHGLKLFNILTLYIPITIANNLIGESYYEFWDFSRSLQNLAPLLIQRMVIYSVSVLHKISLTVC